MVNRLVLKKCSKLICSRRMVTSLPCLTPLATATATATTATSTAIAATANSNQGKPLALPYARAVHEMVPTTPLADKGERPTPHESINDLPVHRLTDPQIFLPVPESRHFTRVDAGRVFSAAPALDAGALAAGATDPATLVDRLTISAAAATKTATAATASPTIEHVGKGSAADPAQQVLLPADARIPHPEQVAFERDRRRSGNSNWRERARRFEARLAQQHAAEEQRRQAVAERRTAGVLRVVPSSSADTGARPARFEYRFSDVVVSRETTGALGRGAAAPGRRYGVPSDERKKGQVKIQTRVLV